MEGSSKGREKPKLKARERLSALFSGRSSSRSSSIEAPRNVDVVDRNHTDSVPRVGSESHSQHAVHVSSNVALSESSIEGPHSTQAIGTVHGALPIRENKLKESRSPATVKGGDDNSVKSAELQAPRPVLSAAVEQCQCWTKALKQLEKNDLEAHARLETMTFDPNHLANKIETIVESYEGKAKGTASSQWFGRLKRLLPTIAAVKGFSMAVSRADPHQIAPYICSGIFGAIELALNLVNPDDILLILEIVSETTILLRKWLDYEAHMVCTPRTQSLSDELIKELPDLYGRSLRLLLSVHLHLSGCRSRKTVERISQIDVQWKAMFEGLKQSNKKCDAIRSQAEFWTKTQKDGETILNWISTRASEDSHNQIMEKIGVSDRYSERGTWLFRSTEFRSWQASIEGNGTKRALWLKGTVGTGKTTLFSRLLEAFIFDQSLGSACQNRICHFYCSAGTTSTPPDSETIIRSLLRQMSLLPDFALSPAAVDMYHRHDSGQLQKTALSLGQWKLLFEVVASSIRGQNPCVIFVDALDECAEGQADVLLEFFGSLFEKVPNIFLFITSQLHVKVPIYIADAHLMTIQTGSMNTREDIAFYVETEIRERANLPRQRKSGILSAGASENLRERLKSTLITGANGMFQWVKIWLAIMFPTEPIVHLSEAEDLLRALEGQRLLVIHEKDQWKALNDAYLNLYIRVRHRPTDRKYKVRAYRVILGAYEPLTAATVAEAASVEDDGTVTTSVTEDNVREVCHNFFVESSGYLQAAHDSAKSFLQTMLEYAGDDRARADDYSQAANKAETARICIKVLMHQDHRIWTRHGLNPGDWANKFADEAQLCAWCEFVDEKTYERYSEQVLYPKTVESFLEWSQAYDVLADHLPSYIIRYWPNHLEDAVLAINSGTLAMRELPLASLVNTLGDHSESALLGCALLMNAHQELFTVTDLDKLIDRSSHSHLAAKLESRNYRVKIDISQCIVELEDDRLTLDMLLLVTALNLVPRVYIRKYCGLESFEMSNIPECECLWRFFDRITATLNVVNATGQTLLGVAIQGKQGEDIVEPLLKLERSRCRGMSLNTQVWTSNLLLGRDTDGNTPLHLAAETLDSPQLIKTILNFEADQMGRRVPDVSRKGRNPSGWLSRNACQVNQYCETPLHLAAPKGNHETISLLVEAGAAEMLVEDSHGVQTNAPVVNSQDRWGQTPLATAARSAKCSSVVVKMLLRLPAVDINLPDYSGKTPLHAATEMNSFEENIQTNRFRITSLLLSDVRIKAGLADKSGRTPLWLAAERGLDDILRLLLDRSDVDPDAPNAKGESPLWIAKYQNLKYQDQAQSREKVLELLLATRRVNTNPLDAKGRSPFQAFQAFQAYERQRAIEMEEWRRPRQEREPAVLR